LLNKTSLNKKQDNYLLNKLKLKTIKNILYNYKMMESKKCIYLFIVLVIIILIDPRWIYNLYDKFIGRLILLIVLVFFATHNTTLGLLVVLALIIVLEQYTTFSEGLDMMGNTAPTIGDDTVSTGQQTVLTRDAAAQLSQATTTPTTGLTISQLKEKAATAGITADPPSSGVDKEDIRNNILPKNSSTLPVSPTMTSSDENVAANMPTTTTTSSTLTEAFCPCLTSYSGMYNLQSIY